MLIQKTRTFISSYIRGILVILLLSIIPFAATWGLTITFGQNENLATMGRVALLLGSLLFVSTVVQTIRASSYDEILGSLNKPKKQSGKKKRFLLYSSDVIHQAVWMIFISYFCIVYGFILLKIGIENVQVSTTAVNLMILDQTAKGLFFDLLEGARYDVDNIIRFWWKDVADIDDLKIKQGGWIAWTNAVYRSFIMVYMARLLSNAYAREIYNRAMKLGVVKSSDS